MDVQGRIGRVGAALLVLASLLGLSGQAAATTVRPGGPQVPVIVREEPGAGSVPEHEVERLGGRVGRQLAIIGGFAAEVPEGAVGLLRSRSDIAAVTPNAPVHLNAMTEVANANRYRQDSIYRVTHGMPGVHVGPYWKAGLTGRGVDVAVIDTGIAPVDGLRAPGKVLHGPDLSFESGDPGVATLDTYGHGTHMAGIIAGRDDAAPAVLGELGTLDHFVGVAPGARIVSVKVGDATGATDVSQVIAAIDWVVVHRRDPGMNIRVLNLSLGTDGVQDYRFDPLTHAAEVAWRRGIVVVAAAGNGGRGSAKLDNPAYDPYLIAVGGVHEFGSELALFTSRGDGTRGPDLLAPGSIRSLRVPGSYLDTTYPQARTGERLFGGHGTSQAAAVVSGAAALIIQQRPGITPDQVKALLTGSARRLGHVALADQGAGVIDLAVAFGRATPAAVQSWPISQGTGSLEAARGSIHVAGPAGGELKGEIDAAGQPWDPAWAGRSWRGETWQGGTWNGARFTGGLWSGRSWRGTTWTGRSWRASGWSAGTWSGRSWRGDSWSGGLWY